MANSFAATTNFASELDKALVQSAVTGIFKDNALGAKFVGTKTVSIPDISLQGLGTYDRANGFVKGDVTVARTSYTLTMDRGRTFTIDRMDNDEADVNNLIGATSGELVRTKVAPEVDAYVLSKLAQKASAKSHTVSIGTSSTLAADAWTMFATALNNVQEATGFSGEPLVCFVDAEFKAALENYAGATKAVVYTDFKKGDINTKVATINGVPILPVSSDRMKNLFQFNNGTTSGQTDGGFVPGSGAKGVGMILCPKGIGGLVEKTEKLRVFNPDQNQDADAYKIDYRLYYDFFIKKSYEDAIYAYVKA